MRNEQEKYDHSVEELKEARSRLDKLTKVDAEHREATAQLDELKHVADKLNEMQWENKQLADQVAQLTAQMEQKKEEIEAHEQHIEEQNDKLEAMETRMRKMKLSTDHEPAPVQFLPSTPSTPRSRVAPPSPGGSSERSRPRTLADELRALGASTRALLGGASPSTLGPSPGRAPPSPLSIAPVTGTPARDPPAASLVAPEVAVTTPVTPQRAVSFADKDAASSAALAAASAFDKSTPGGKKAPPQPTPPPAKAAPEPVLSITIESAPVDLSSPVAGAVPEPSPPGVPLVDFPFSPTGAVDTGSSSSSTISGGAPATPSSTTSASSGVRTPMLVSPGKALSPEQQKERDANYEFFALTLLAVKIDYGHRMGGDSTEVQSTLNPRDLWMRAQDAHIPFHQYHRYIETEVAKVTSSMPRLCASCSAYVLWCVDG